MTLSHLDDEALSAALDGEATAEEQSHLAACTECQARIGALRTVARVVSVPVPSRPRAAMDSAIQEAVGAAWVVGAGDGAGAAAGAGGEIGSGVAAGRAWRSAARRSGARRPDTGRFRFGGADGRPSRPSRLVLVAAVIVVVLGAAGGLLGVLNRGSTKTASTSSLGASQSRSAPGAPTSLSGPANDQVRGVNPGTAPSAAAGALPSSGAAFQLGPDLGTQSDPAAVAGLVDGGLNAGGEAGPSTLSPAGGRTAAALSCVTQGATAVGLPGRATALIYGATIRWQGEPGVVLVYLRPAGGRAGVVMRVSDCSRLADLPL